MPAYSAKHTASNPSIFMETVDKAKRCPIALFPRQQATGTTRHDTSIILDISRQQHQCQQHWKCHRWWHPWQPKMEPNCGEQRHCRSQMEKQFNKCHPHVATISAMASSPGETWDQALPESILATSDASNLFRARVQHWCHQRHSIIWNGRWSNQYILARQKHKCNNDIFWQLKDQYGASVVHQEKEKKRQLSNCNCKWHRHNKGECHLWHHMCINGRSKRRSANSLA